MNAQSVEGVFGKSWDLLTRNWVLIVPGLVIGFVLGIAQGVLAPNGPADSGSVGPGGPQVIGYAVVSIIGLLGGIANTAYTTGMAGAAWQNGTTTLADGRRAFERDAGHVFVAMIALFALGVIGPFLALLAFFALGGVLTFIVSVPALIVWFLAYLLLFIYTMPSAVVGERRGLEALGESYRIATKRFWTTVIVVVLIAIIAVLAGLIATALNFAPFVGPLISDVIYQVMLTYISLVVVGEYLNLRNDSAQSIV